MVGVSIALLTPGEEETQKRLEDTMIVGPGGTQAPRAWSWKSGRESVERKRKFGEEAVSSSIESADESCSVEPVMYSTRWPGKSAKTSGSTAHHRAWILPSGLISHSC